MYKFVGLALLLIPAFALYVRYAPVDAGRWHIDPNNPKLRSKAGAFLVRADGAMKSPLFNARTAEVLQLVDEIAMATPRTRRIAGSVEEGRLTYETRSKLWGFPDYTTVAAIPSDDNMAELVIYARLRFGKDDLGVNRKRVKSWLAQISARLPS